MSNEPIRLPGWRDEVWRYKYTTRGRIGMLLFRLNMKARAGRVILAGLIAGLLIGAAVVYVLIGGM